MAALLRIVPGLLIGLALVGCGRYFPPDRNVKRHVTEAEVVGVWQMTPCSLALLQRDGVSIQPSHTHTITFDADGSLQFDSVLDDFRGGGYLRLEGTWSLEHDTTGDSNVRKANALRIELAVTPNFTRTIFYLNFVEEDGNLVLWNYYGDPDEWEFIEYERRP